MQGTPEQVAPSNIHDAQRRRLHQLEGEHHTIMSPMGRGARGANILLCLRPENPTALVSLRSHHLFIPELPVAVGA